jgi:hypothetical protein
VLAPDLFLQYFEKMRQREYLDNFDLMLLQALLRSGEGAITRAGVREVRKAQRSLVNLWKDQPN